MSVYLIHLHLQISLFVFHGTFGALSIVRRVHIRRLMTVLLWKMDWKEMGKAMNILFEPEQLVTKEQS